MPCMTRTAVSVSASYSPVRGTGARFAKCGAEDAVRHERLRVVVFLLDTPQTYLKIVDMAALLFVCVHFHSSSLST